jgi:hydrocephalus-inducing protein
MGGKRYEMMFEYTPETDEISEAFWRFRIPSQEISIPFLLVGNVLEPRVSLNCANVNFHKVLTGSRARETLYLYNNEKIPFQFAFDKSSYVSGEFTGKHAPLTFEPDSGILNPDQQLAVTMTFCPPAEREFNYNVTCAVKKKPTRLTLNVKGEGYAVHHSMQLENQFGKPIELSVGVNNIEFGQVQVRAPAWSTTPPPHLVPALCCQVGGSSLSCAMSSRNTCPPPLSLSEVLKGTVMLDR